MKKKKVEVLPDGTKTATKEKKTRTSTLDDYLALRDSVVEGILSDSASAETTTEETTSEASEPEIAVESTEETTSETSAETEAGTETSDTAETETSGTAETETSDTAGTETSGTSEAGTETSGTAETETSGTAETETSGTAETETSGTSEAGTETSDTSEAGTETSDTAETGTETSDTAETETSETGTEESISDDSSSGSESGSSVEEISLDGSAPDILSTTAIRRAVSAIFVSDDSAKINSQLENTVKAILGDSSLSNEDKSVRAAYLATVIYEELKKQGIDAHFTAKNDYATTPGIKKAGMSVKTKVIIGITALIAFVSTAVAVWFGVKSSKAQEEGYNQGYSAGLNANKEESKSGESNVRFIGFPDGKNIIIQKDEELKECGEEWANAVLVNENITEEAFNAAVDQSRLSDEDKETVKAAYAEYMENYNNQAQDPENPQEPEEPQIVDANSANIPDLTNTVAPSLVVKELGDGMGHVVYEQQNDGNYSPSYIVTDGGVRLDLDNETGKISVDTSATMGVVSDEDQRQISAIVNYINSVIDDGDSKVVVDLETNYGTFVNGIGQDVR